MREISIAEILTQVRKEHHYTRRELAAELDCPYSTLTKYENGTREPSYKYLRKFARMFNTTVDCLIGCTDNSIADVRTDSHPLFVSFNEGTVQKLHKHPYCTVFLQTEEDYDRFQEMLEFWNAHHKDGGE